MRKILITLMLVSIAIILITGCNKKGINQGTKNMNSEQKDTSNKKEKREVAPDFSLSDGQGNIIKLSDYRGKLLFLNFFTSWCTYCKQEMPEFNAVYEAYGNEEIDILIVDVLIDEDKTMEEILKWYNNEGYNIPIVFDEDGKVTSSYFINGYPTTYVIDEEGYVIGFVSGGMDGDMLEDLINTYK